MTKATIKSRIYIGIIILVILSVIIFGILSWFARDSVLKEVNSIEYNSFLTHKIKDIEIISEEKISLLYQGIIEKHDVSADLVQKDNDINSVCAGVISDIYSAGILGSDSAAAEVEQIIKSILKSESEITNYYNSLIKPTIIDSGEEELKESIKSAIMSWNNLTENILAHRDNNIVKINSLINDLNDNIGQAEDNAEDITNQFDELINQTTKIETAALSLSNQAEILLEQNSNAFNVLYEMIYEAASAEEIQAIDIDTVPVYEFNETEESISKYASIVSSNIKALKEEESALISELNQLSSVLDSVGKSNISELLVQNSELTKAGALSQEIALLSALSGLYQDASLFDTQINDKTVELSDVLKGDNSQIGLNKINEATAELETIKSNIKAFKEDQELEGISKIKEAREELLPVLDLLNQKLQTNFDENINSKHVDSYIIRGLIIMLVLLLALGILMALFISRSIIKSINQMTSFLKETGKGNYKSRISKSIAPEFKQMAQSVNLVLDTREEILEETTAVSKCIRKLHSELIKIIANNKEHLNTMAMMQDILNQFKSQFLAFGDNETIESVELDAAVTRETIVVTEHGMGVAQNAKDTIERASETVKDIARQIEQLDDSSGRIGEITDIITEIAKRTNLLSLNAGIEAARAGGQGRGFSILADEIRRLADESGNAANDIKLQIDDIQKQIQLTAQNMDEGVNRIDESAKSASNVQQSIEDIAQRVQWVLGTVGDYVQKSNKRLMANQNLMDTIGSINNFTDLREMDQSIDHRLEASKKSIVQMERIGSMLKDTDSKLKKILTKYKGRG